MLVSASCKRNQPEDGPPPLASEDIDRACARIVSCELAGTESPGHCATSALTRPASGIRLTQEWIDCLDQAGGDCDAVGRCAPRISGDPCEHQPQGSSCQGDLLVSCFGGNLEFLTDCAAWGLTCAEIDDEATCQGDGPSCLVGDEECQGNTAVMCLGYREARFSCGDLVRRRTCQERSGLAECLPETEECTRDLLTGACDGTFVGFCSADGGAAAFDCAALGFDGCVQEGDRAVCGTPPP
jgi:hypothetical protein